MKTWWTNIRELKESLKNTEKERDNWKERVDYVERRVEKNYGIKVRYETTVVNTDFTKIELVAMMIGIDRLLKESKSSADTKFYIELRDKVQDIVNKMEEK